MDNTNMDRRTAIEAAGVAIAAMVGVTGVKAEEKPASYPMGIGELGASTTIFVRQFRWIMESEHLKAAFNKYVNFDWHNKMINLGIYEVCVNGKVPGIEWAEAMERGEYRNEELTFITLDGCGYPLYARKFTGLKIVKRNTTFDVASSEESVQHMQISYKNCETVPVDKQPWQDVEPSKPKDIRGKKIEISEIEIDHLNEKIFIPGKAWLKS